MSSSFKKKTSKQLKTYLAILLPVLVVLLLLAAILTLGNFTAKFSENTQPSTASTVGDDTTEATQTEPGETQSPQNTEPPRVGIDVSEHQKNIDWEEVKASGVDYVMIRLGYRGYTEGRLYMDTYFDQHYRGAKEAGLDVGVYFFSQATTVREACSEARFVLAVLGWRELDMGIAFDWEFVNGDARTAAMDGRTMTDCAIAFCDIISAAGHAPMVYFNQYQVDNYYILDELTDYDFWLAKYADEMNFDYPVKMWQYTDSGTVPGIPIPVDVNLYWP